MNLTNTQLTWLANNGIETGIGGGFRWFQKDDMFIHLVPGPLFMVERDCNDEDGEGSTTVATFSTLRESLNFIR